MSYICDIKPIIMTKSALFEKDLQEASALFKALAHPARLAILKYIAESKSCISGDISNELPLSRTTVHQHLAELKKHDLIQGEIDGVKTCYCLNVPNMLKIKHQLSNFLTNLNCC